MVIVMVKALVAAVVVPGAPIVVGGGLGGKFSLQGFRTWANGLLLLLPVLGDALIHSS